MWKIKNSTSFLLMIKQYISFSCWKNRTPIENVDNQDKIYAYDYKKSN